MLFVRLLRLRLVLLWSLGGFAINIGLAMAASQRVLLTMVLLATAIGLSASISHALIVDEQQALALTPPSPKLIEQSIRAADVVFPTPLQLPGAKVLWDAYKRELSDHSHNRNLLTNLILLASVLDLEKDVMVYQRQLYLTDPLLSCAFSNSSDGLLQIDCPTTQL